MNRGSNKRKWHHARVKVLRESMVRGLEPKRNALKHRGKRASGKQGVKKG